MKVHKYLELDPAAVSSSGCVAATGRIPLRKRAEPLAGVGSQELQQYAWQAMNDLVLQNFVERLLTIRFGAIDLLGMTSERLGGGISAEQVIAVTASFLDRTGHRETARWVVKELRGPASREAVIHAQLERSGIRIAPRLVGAFPEPGYTILITERATPAERWPWRRVANAEKVLRVVAGLHEASLPVEKSWDYDAELRAMAALTLDAVNEACGSESLSIDRASARAVRRLVNDLPKIRRALTTGGPFRPTLIHGDVHPGNAIVPRQAPGSVPVLVDWGRARSGSPLEDVASWIQSLGCWEPMARLRHDTLVASYLRARGNIGPIPAEVREALWLAGGSNALAGALRYHLVVGCDRSRSSRERARALAAVHDWLRIIRRAAATWCEVDSRRASFPPVAGPLPGTRYRASVRPRGMTTTRATS